MNIFHDLLNRQAERTVFEFVGIEGRGHESGLMPLGVWPQERVARIAGPVGAHAGRQRGGLGVLRKARSRVTAHLGPVPARPSFATLLIAGSTANLR